MLPQLKQTGLVFILLLLVKTGFSQKLPLPTLIPDKPTPENLRPLTPPDLKVEEFSLVSVTRDAAAKKINVQVLIRVKNIGQLRSGNSTIVAYMKSPSGTGAERRAGTTLPISGIGPGSSFVKVFTFREAESLFRPGTFLFWIKADAWNAVAESNETNNISTKLNIETPAL